MHLIDRGARIAAVAALLLMIGGLVLALASSGTASIIGAGLVGIGAAILIGVAFYVVGRSEDLDRMHRHPHG